MNKFLVAPRWAKMWASMEQDYPFRAVAKIGSPIAHSLPIDIYGNYATMGSEVEGYRLWGFKTLEARDLFVRTHGAEADPQA